MPRQPDAADRLAPWLILARAPGVGPRTFGRLLDQFGSPEAALAAPDARLREAGLKQPALDHLHGSRSDVIAADLRWLEHEGAQVVTRHDDAYPPLLAELADSPPLLFVLGDPDLLSQPQIAIVGSRNPTPGGRENAQQFARHLAGAGLTITSGLAIGIDTAAHEGGLEGGTTIAVLGTGPDRVYPASNRALAHRIAATGALVTEFPPGTGTRAEYFPRRNRLISGLSLGTLVVEAAVESGSLITARLAGEQGREVFAIPGSIHNPLARGCHALIRQGAKLVENAEDILVELAPLLRATLAERPAPDQSQAAGIDPEDPDEDYRELLSHIGHDPVAPDELIVRSGIGAQAIASMLLMLELQGKIVACPGGRYCRAGPTHRAS